MKVQIHGASTLRSFTDSITNGFLEAGSDVVTRNPDVHFIQVHSSPESLLEDLEILKATEHITKAIFLFHRPDEFLLHEHMKTFFNDRKVPIVLFGDLVQSEFWNHRKDETRIIPHPFFNLARPSLSYDEKIIVGAWTNWGEMRNLEHFFKLCSAIKKIDLDERFSFYAGGFLNGKLLDNKILQSELMKLPMNDGPAIEHSEEIFIPHFNTQLFHLNGKKRLGESSGSLHRGITIPVIFEANRAEEIENLKAIKIHADDELTVIDFGRAAQEIVGLTDDGYEKWLQFNLRSAQHNLPVDFARKILSLK